MDAAAAVARCITALAPGMRKATVYLSAKEVVSACRRFKFSKRSRRDDFVVKIGAPNYEEARFIARCKRERVDLALVSLQVKPWPAKKKPAR